MKLITGLLLLFLCGTIEAYNDPVPYIQVASVSSSKPKKCLEPGLLCETCSSLVACIETSDGTYIKEPLETCDSPQKCVGGACVQNTTDPFCSGLADFKFICRKAGIFPDPFYCDRFVLCVNSSSSSTLVPYVNECEEGFQFDVATSLCDVELEHGQCEEGKYPVPICKELGQSGALPGRPEMFYICEDYNNRLYPVLNVCPGGQIYDDYMCTTLTSTTPWPTTTPTPTWTPWPTTIHPTSTTPRTTWTPWPTTAPWTPPTTASTPTWTPWPTTIPTSTWTPWPTKTFPTVTTPRTTWTPWPTTTPWTPPTTASTPTWTPWPTTTPWTRWPTTAPWITTTPRTTWTPWRTTTPMPTTTWYPTRGSRSN